MAVKIRLKRMGAKKAPFYRIVVADARSPRDGRFIESIGYYDSTVQPASVKIDAEKAIDWMNKGAQPTDTVKNLFSKDGIMKTSQKPQAPVHPEGMEILFFYPCPHCGRHVPQVNPVAAACRLRCLRSVLPHCSH